MASTPATGFFRPLTENPFLRLATVFVFYIFEGVPMGLFYVAVPAYMAGAGASVPEIAAVVGAFSLPWTLKLVNGFLMDRYTFLPMGRRRIWIIASQSIMALGLLTAAAFAPSGTDVALLSALGFIISAATTFQDVSIDSLVVDLLNEEEQAKAGGIMFGAQTLGASGATAAGGYLLDQHGSSLAFTIAAAFLGFGVLFAILLQERPGERRLPWSAGEAHPRNLEIKIDAWWPLLKQSFWAMVAPASLVILPFLLVRNIPAGIYDIFNPIISNDYVGWSPTQYTSVSSVSQLATGILGLVVGGWLTAKLGSRRMLQIMFLFIAVLLVSVGLLKDQWSNPNILMALIWGIDFAGIFIAIAMIPLAMQVCTPAVAATQFTIYMALANFGRPIGAAIVTGANAIDPQMVFYSIGGIMLLGAVGTIFLKTRAVSREVEVATHHGVGAAPSGN